MRVPRWTWSILLAAAATACGDALQPAPAPPPAALVATGGSHSCALTVDGAAYCWGRGMDGELGAGERTPSAVPVAVAGSLRFAALTAGVSHTCALTLDGEAYCWGWNAFFQRGNPDDPMDAAPVPVSTDLRFRELTAGWYHTCAIDLADRAHCWGHGRFGQLGHGAAGSAIWPEPVAGELRFATLSAGAWHTCGLARDGQAHCWGLNDQGQLGSASDEAQLHVPIPVATPGPLVAVTAGASHSCGLDAAGVAYCWGSNEHGELGDGTRFRPGLPGQPRPVPVAGGVRFSAVSAGELVTCGVRRDTGMGYCWGRGMHGQLGNGALRDHSVPQPIHLQPGAQHGGDLLRFRSVSAAGLTHACGVTGDAAVFCWGSGPDGALGHPRMRFSTLPVRVALAP
jgi:alpha-tubulin suppressor-like RCC1 family protein